MGSGAFAGSGLGTGSGACTSSGCAGRGVAGIGLGIRLESVHSSSSSSQPRVLLHLPQVSPVPNSDSVAAVHDNLVLPVTQLLHDHASLVLADHSQR